MKSIMARDEDYDSWPEIALERQIEDREDRLVIAYLELGLRWLHDHSGNEYYRWIDKAEEHGWSHE